MASLRDQATLFLSKANADLVALDALINSDKVSGEIKGFHAQQAVEKALKAVLVVNAIVFRKTHDIAELIDLMEDNDIAFPQEFEQAVALTPFAVQFRYGFLPQEDNSIDQSKWIEIRELVFRIFTWSSQQLASNEQ